MTAEVDGHPPCGGAARTTVRRMPLRRCAAATVLSVVTLVGWSVGQVSAGIEPSCVQVNNGDFDGYGGTISFAGPFIAGDTIFVHSGEPSERQGAVLCHRRRSC